MGSAPITKRLLKLYRQADEVALIDGRGWYHAAHAECVDLAERVGLSLETVVAVVASLSPGLRWQRNVSAAERCIARYFGDVSAADAFRLRMVGTHYGRPIRAAYQCLRDGSEPTGPKVLRFYRNILGDENEITLDRWALRAAIGREVPSGPVERRAVWAAYENAARIAGETPRGFQAVVWCVARGSSSVNAQLKFELVA